MFYTLINIIIINFYLLSSYAAVPKGDKFTKYLSFRETLYKALLKHAPGAAVIVTAAGIKDISPIRVKHQRGSWKRTICAVYKEDSMEGGRGINNQKRRILQVLSPNIVSRSQDRHVSRPRTGCISCDVALCKTGGCWEAFHTELNNRVILLSQLGHPRGPKGYPLVPPEPLPHGLDPLQLTCK